MVCSVRKIMEDDGWDPFAEEGGDPPAVKDEDDASNARTSGNDANIERTSGSSFPTQHYCDEVAAHVYNLAMIDQYWKRAPSRFCDLSWYQKSCTLQGWRHKAITLDMGQNIAYFTLNRPESANKFNDDMNLALLDAIANLHERKDLRVVVFMNQGKMFCGGMETECLVAANEIAQIRGEPRAEYPIKGAVQKAACRNIGERAQNMGAFPDGVVNMTRILTSKQLHAWCTVPQFNVCVMNGSAIGWGVGCVCCCDTTLAQRSTFLLLEEPTLGNIPAVMAPFIVQKIGAAHAKRFFCTGECIPAERAKEIGLVNRLYDNMEDAHEIIKDICETVTQCGPRMVEAAKTLVVRVGGQPIHEPIMMFSASMLAMVTVGEEARVGMKALIAKVPKPWEEEPHIVKPLY